MKQIVVVYIVKMLEQVGVKCIWGVIGDFFNGLSDSFNCMGIIDWMFIWYEEVVVFVVGVEVQLIGELVVCVGFCGLGNLYLINGLFDCYCNYVLVLVIVVYILFSEIGSGYFQEIYFQELFCECSYYCELVFMLEQILQVLVVVMCKVVINCGVLVVVLFGDVVLKVVLESVSSYWYYVLLLMVILVEEELCKLVQFICYFSNIVFMCGSGCVGVYQELVEFVVKIKVFIVYVLCGKEYVEYDNLYDVGMIGLIGFVFGFYIMMNVDILILLGIQFFYCVFYLIDVKIIQIDINFGSIGVYSKVDMVLVGDIKLMLKVLLLLLEEKIDCYFFDKVLEYYCDV